MGVRHQVHACPVSLAGAVISIIFVATKVCLSRQKFCRDKLTLQQTRVCRDKTRLLSR